MAIKVTSSPRVTMSKKISKSNAGLAARLASSLRRKRSSKKLQDDSSSTTSAATLDSSFRSSASSCESSLQSFETDTHTSILKTSSRHNDKKSLRVRWAAQECSSIDHVHVNDLSDQEKAQAFYSADELASIGRRMDRLVQKLESTSSTSSTSGHCLRGLEKFYGSRREIAVARKTKAWDAVLDLQEQQWQWGVLDDDEQREQEALATVYQPVSQAALKHAQDVAASDAQAARKYLSQS